MQKMTSHIFRHIFIVLAILLSGCASNKTLSREASMPTSEEALVVFKLTPSNATIALLEASVENGFVKSNAVFGVRGKPVDEYVPVILKANTTYKISMITLSVMDQSAGFYHACDGAKTVAFKTQPGKVMYITDVNFSSKNGKFHIDYKNDFVSAKKYIDENFVNLKGNLIAGAYEMVTPVEKCGSDESSSIVVVPYIPRKK